MLSYIFKHKYFLIPVFIIVFGAGIALGIYIRNRTLNPLATIPSPLERILGFAVREVEKEEDDLLYYDANLADFVVNGSKKTKVAVEGIVEKISHQPDGDYHVIVTNGPALALVTEFIPEIKLPLPKVGDKIKIWGIVRFDVLHNWWEFHPVIGWEKLK